MKGYPIVAVIWNDPHIVLRQELPSSSDEFVFGPTLTVGLLFKRAKDYIIIIHTLEKGEDFDEADYTVIFKGCIVSMQEYGILNLDEIKSKGAI